jgi:hypothetical protein
MDLGEVHSAEYSLRVVLHRASLVNAGVLIDDRVEVLPDGLDVPVAQLVDDAINIVAAFGISSGDVRRRARAYVRARGREHSVERAVELAQPRSILDEGRA